MKARKLFNYVVLAIPCMFFAGNLSAKVTEEDFKVKTTRNLLNLCTAAEDDAQSAEAIHFCHGYLVGAFHFYNAQVANEQNDQLFCLPEPKPSRNETIGKFVAWALNHPEYMGEIPVDTEFRFLAESFPCK